MDIKNHWDRIYETKRPDEVSWTQVVPGLSLDLIRKLNLPEEASIIDIGGGDSRLADYLLADGYKNITVLDISTKAVERAKVRLGEKASAINWIISDILDFRPNIRYEVWHDRAAFHFLTTPESIARYGEIAASGIKGYLITGTFSERGPERCSGLSVSRYSEKLLEETFSGDFEKLECRYSDHVTPSGNVQNFLFCLMKRKTEF